MIFLLSLSICMQTATEAPHYDQGRWFGPQCHKDQATTLLHQGECRHTSSSFRGNTQGLIRQMTLSFFLFSLIFSIYTGTFLNIFF